MRVTHTALDGLPEGDEEDEEEEVLSPPSPMGIVKEEPEGAQTAEEDTIGGSEVAALPEGSMAGSSGDESPSTSSQRQSERTVFRSKGVELSELSKGTRSRLRRKQREEDAALAAAAAALVVPAAPEGRTQAPPRKLWPGTFKKPPASLGPPPPLTSVSAGDLPVPAEDDEKWGQWDPTGKRPHKEDEDMKLEDEDAMM